MSAVRILVLSSFCLPFATVARAQTATSTPAEAAAPVAEDPAAAEAAAAAAAAEAEAMIAAMAAEAPMEQQGPSLSFYGFSDFTASKFLVGKDSGWDSVFRDETAFYIGNLNLYMDADLTNDFRSLMEIRFMFLPAGTDDPNAPGFLDPSVNSRYKPAADYANAERAISWGAISIQRAYLEYTLHSLVRMRAGRFLTPWGIWNVDHGTPVIISSSRPYIIGEGFFPEAQTGFEVFGARSWDHLSVGYHFTLSNGRGPIEQYGDFDSNKAIGGRIWLSNSDFGDLKFGVSAYYGTNTDKRQKIDITAASPLPTSFVFERSREYALAADVRFESGPLLLQSEIAMQDRVWDDDARPFDVQGNVQADNRRMGAYLVAAYRLPWYNIRPFLQFEYYNSGTATGLGGARDLLSGGPGLNIRIQPNVVLKASYSHVFFFKPVAGSLAQNPIDVVAAQVAWAF